MINKMEVLSPAGNWESLKAAAASGADAVYFGSSDFNARRGAENFTNDEIRDVIKFCHERGIKAHFTLNTVIFENETDQALSLASLVCKAGADAIIIQDIGLAKLIREAAPEMKLHASTQLSVHNLCGVNELAKMGFSRVVLGRELSFEEIAQIAEKSPVELEIFVHGALCMSISGQCYMSAFFGGSRSGNRGLCAQPCRLPFSVGNYDNVLSLKDLSLVTDIRELSKYGEFSLKIEGRRKRPEYVAAATALCAKAVRGEDISCADLEQLRAVFSREGFTKGYFEGKRGSEMFGTRTPEDEAASSGVLKKIRSAYEGAEPPRIKVDFAFSMKSSGTKLSARDEDGNFSEVTGEKPEKAIKREMDRVTVCEKLSKTGGTPFFAGEIKTSLEKGLTVPVSEINRLRRETLSEILKKRGAAREIQFKFPKRNFSTENHDFVEKVRLRFRSADQIPHDLDFDGVEFIILPVPELLNGVPPFISEKVNVCAELPRAFFGNDELLLKHLEKIKEFGVQDALCGNVGALNLAEKVGFKIHGDFGLNITNSEAANVYSEQGLRSCTISFETPLAVIREITARSKIPSGLIVYGRLPLMLVRNCPVRTFSSCGGNCKIKDRTGCFFPVVCQKGENAAGGQCVEILNSRPLWLADSKRDMEKSNLSFFEFYFTKEDAREAESAINAWKSGTPYDGEFTRGLYFHSIL